MTAMSSEMETKEFPRPPSPERRLAKKLAPVVEANVAGRSHAGRVRSKNEDHFLVVRFGRFLESLESNLPADDVPARVEEHGYAMAVADGMGGHAAGEEASRFAITTLLNLVLTTPDWILRADEPPLANEIMRRAAKRLKQVDRALVDQAENVPRFQGFGTTMTLAANIGNGLFVAHIGDSRAYVLRRGILHQLTRDHTLVRELYEAGVITYSQAASHRLRHVLTRNLGADRIAKPDVQKFALESGDRLLLCSDGLSEMVGNDAIAAALSDHADSSTKCDRLIDLALAAGGKDNVTAIVAQYDVSQEGTV
jgi:protein phosphatase